MDMFVIATAGQAQEWNIQVPELDWPNTVTTEFAWNLCNFGVRARMGWSHVSAPLELGTLAETSEEVPVVLTQRFMRGQREPVVIESYDVRSAYESGPLRFGCVLDVSYPVGATSRMEVSVCVVPFLALAPRQVLLCENQNERITVSSALAGVAPDKDLSTIIRELDRITSGSIPSRDETITTLRSP